jgi:hypothetical protein
VLYKFLIEDNKGVVLHTGDFRAEPCFLNRISRNPFLQRYLVQPSEHSVRTCSARRMTLDTIYLDTASLLSNLGVPTKVWDNTPAFFFGVLLTFFVFVLLCSSV